MWIIPPSPQLLISLTSRETIRGLSTAAIFKYVDSVAESFISCISLILASFVVAIALNKQIPYPFVLKFIVIVDSLSVKIPWQCTVTFYLAVITLCIATYLYEAGSNEEEEKGQEQEEEEGQEMTTREGRVVPDSIEVDW